MLETAARAVAASRTRARSCRRGGRAATGPTPPAEAAAAAAGAGGCAVPCDVRRGAPPSDRYLSRATTTTTRTGGASAHWGCAAGGWSFRRDFSVKVGTRETGGETGR